MKKEITCLLALHAEGLIAHKTIRSLNRAAECAERFGISVEFVFVLDRATQETRRYIESSAVVSRFSKVIAADFGDLGLTRNLGIQHSEGEYIAILDGDDLISENWLLRAYELSRQDSRFIVHPEVSLAFDQKAVVMYHPDQRESDFDGANLIVENYWTSLCFSQRETFIEIPYVAMPESSGFGYEDWYWNCEVMAHGFIHTVAVGTAHFIRAKASGGLMRELKGRNAVIPHSAALYNVRGRVWKRKRVADAGNN